MTAGIYVIRNLVNGFEYVGQSDDIRGRWSDHRKLLNKGTHPNPRLQNSWRKHGKDAFIFEMLEVVSDLARLNDREIYWGEAREPIYNLEPLGNFRRNLDRKDYSYATAMRVEIAFMEIQSTGRVVTAPDIAQRTGLANFTVWKVLRDAEYWTEELATEARNEGRSRSVRVSSRDGFPNLVTARQHARDTGAFQRNAETMNAKMRAVGYPNLARGRETSKKLGIGAYRPSDDRRDGKAVIAWSLARAERVRVAVLEAFNQRQTDGLPITQSDIARDCNVSWRVVNKTLRAAGLWTPELAREARALGGRRAYENNPEATLNALKRGRETLASQVNPHISHDDVTR
jgi:hypothetical protein